MLNASLLFFLWFLCLCFFEPPNLAMYFYFVFKTNIMDILFIFGGVSKSFFEKDSIHIFYNTIKNLLVILHIPCQKKSFLLRDIFFISGQAMCAI